jgi:large subunit ribosomal protein L9
LARSKLTHDTETIMSNSKPKTKTPRFKPLPKGETKGVQLLLIQTVDHLGKQGDVVEVKAGYARNYLLPQGLATIATDHHKRMVEKHRAKLMEIEKARLSNLRQLADLLGRQSITIEANANDDGHLYGSVGPNDIVAELKKAGFNVTTDQIRLEGLLKELGLYTVRVHLHSDIDAEMKVWVVPTVTSEAAVAKSEKGEKSEKSEKA